MEIFFQHQLGMVYWVHTPWKLLQDFKVEKMFDNLENLEHYGELGCLLTTWLRELDSAVALLKGMRIQQIRTNVSWAEFVTLNGPLLQGYYLKKFAEDFEILPCFNYTPPSIAEEPSTNAPPKRLEDFADFISEVHRLWPGLFKIDQLWNEPNLNTDWNPHLDPDGKKFVFMINRGAEAAHASGVKTMLGGMNKLDVDWMCRFCDLGGMENFDCVGLNGLRATWTEAAPPLSWPERAGKLAELIKSRSGKAVPIVVTEAGYPTIDYRSVPLPQTMLQDIQCSVFLRELEETHSLGVPFYWYTLKDLQPEIKSVRAVTTGWEDKIQYHFGCLMATGRCKLLGQLLLGGGVENVKKYVWENDLATLWQTVIERGEPS